MTNLYKDHNPEELGKYYIQHIDRMTVENLYGKSDIACELAYRDIIIASLRDAAKKALDAMERYKDKRQCDRFDEVIEELKKELFK
jgi:hypothetical protein